MRVRVGCEGQGLVVCTGGGLCSTLAHLSRGRIIDVAVRRRSRVFKGVLTCMKLAIKVLPSGE